MIGAKFAAVIGDNELESGTVKLKNMSGGEQFDIALDNKFTENFSKIFIV